MINEYSETWVNTFLDRINEEQTKKEIDFLMSFLENITYPRVLDLGCGLGRHSKGLASRNCIVTGIDSNTTLIQYAKTDKSSVDFRVLDMRELTSLRDSYDLIISMWQSFGYYDAATNRNILTNIFDKLALGGLFVLDIYHRSFFEKFQGKRDFVKEGQQITEIKEVKNKRLSVTLIYNQTNTEDNFNWELFVPEEIVEICEEIGFNLHLKCREFDREKEVDPNHPRVQYVFVR